MTSRELVAYFDEIHALNRKCLDLVNEEQLNFKPALAVKTLRKLFQHMYVNQKFYLITAQRGTMDVNDYKQMMAQEFATKEALRSFIEATYAEARPFLIDEQFLKKELEVLVGQRTCYHLFLGELEHQLHHRGQVYTYLRLLGIKPPDAGYFMGVESQ